MLSQNDAHRAGCIPIIELCKIFNDVFIAGGGPNSVGSLR